MSLALEFIRYDEEYNPILEYYNWINLNRKNRRRTSKKVLKVYAELVKIINNPKSEWEYDSKKANHAIEFIENYTRHSKGKMGGKRFILELWQKALVAATFGIVHKIDGIRKFKEVLLIVARKNGKSTLASAIGLYLQIADGEPGAEIYACATKKDQAKIIWSEARRMVRKSPSLRKRMKTLVAEINSELNDSIFKPLGRDSDTLDGLNVHGALLDEIHAWQDQNLYDVIVDGTSAREEPLVFITTTAGTVRERVYDLKYNEAVMTINGYNDPNGFKNESFLPIIYELNDRKDWTEEECWYQANPGLGTIKQLSYIKDKVNKAQANSLLVKNVLCKDFNIRETTTEAWLSFEELNNQNLIDLGKLNPRYCIGGADLGATTDLTAACILFKVPNDENIYVKHMYWLPEEVLEQRIKEDKVPYDKWHDQGYLRVTPGHKVHYSFVVQWFLEVQNEMDIYISYIGYDAWSATYFVEELKNTFGGHVPQAVRQGKQTLSIPMKNLGADLKANLLVYDNNPITKWCISNTAVDIDRNDNIQPKKTSNPRMRIDGLASMLDAYVIYQEKYQEYMSLV